MATIEGYNMPDDLYYHEDDTWVRVEDENLRIGMTDFYQKMAGETTYVDLPFDGDEIGLGETCGKIQSAKWVGKFVSPVSGEIIEVNGKLEDDCSLINKDPYGEGWIMVVKPSDWEEEQKKLIHGNAVESWLKPKIKDAEQQIK
jgi:glycine cleavage system H protein